MKYILYSLHHASSIPGAESVTLASYNNTMFPQEWIGKLSFRAYQMVVAAGGDITIPLKVTDPETRIIVRYSTFAKKNLFDYVLGTDPFEKILV